MKPSILIFSLLALALTGRAWPGPYEFDPGPYEFDPGAQPFDAGMQQPAGPELVTAEWLKRHLSDPGQLVLHVAMQRLQYDAGHVPGSVFAPMGESHGHSHSDQLPDPAAIAAALGRLGVTNDTRVVLVGDPLGTSIFYVALDYVGHGDKVAVLDGGIAAWREAGGALSKEAVAANPATFTPNVRTDMVVTAEWVRKNLGDRKLALLDVRTRAEYDGTANERLPRKGHIPGAKFLPWLETFDLRDVPRGASGERADNAPESARLRPRVELQQLLAAAGARNDGVVVSYCTVGMRASHMYFVSRLLGLPSKIYVGSMADWTRNAGNPVVGVGNQ